MNLTIGNTSIPVLSCTRMRDTVRGFYLDIKIPQENIGMSALYDMFAQCGDNNIAITEDDGTVNTYMGFKTLSSFACENGIYRIAQVCTSEYEAQLSLAQSKITEQDAIIAAQTEHIIALEEANTELKATQEANDAELLYQVCLLQLGLADNEL